MHRVFFFLKRYQNYASDEVHVVTENQSVECEKSSQIQNFRYVPGYFDQMAMMYTEFQNGKQTFTLDICYLYFNTLAKNDGLLNFT